MRTTTPAAPADLTDKFTRLYYAEVDPEELAVRAASDLEGAAAGHLAFARRFSGGKPKIRAFNPTREKHGWHSTHTVVEILNDDMPFLVDSVTMEVNRQGLTLHLLIHPVLRVVRDAAGELVRIAAPREAAEGRLESYMHVEVDRQTDPAKLAGLEAGIAKVLADVRAAVEDWRPMQARLAEQVRRLDAPVPGLAQAELEEGRAFLAWLLDHHFTFVGCREYRLDASGGEDVLRIVPGSGLGILRERGERVSASFATLPPEARRRARVKELLVLTKANARSTVHRPGHLDYVGIKQFDAAGQVTGEMRYLGLYTHTAYAESPSQVPLLRRKLADVIERAGLLPAGYSGKALASILESYPRDELLQISAEDLYRHAMAILQLGERQRLRLLVRQDPYARFVSCIIFVPRDRYNTDLRMRFQRILLEAFHGVSCDFDVDLSTAALGRILMRIRTRPGELAPQPQVSALEARLAGAMRRWEDELYEALLERHGEEQANRLWRSYAEAFPPGYRAEYGVAAALADVEAIESLEGEALGMNLYAPPGAPAELLRFKIYRRGERIALSDTLPMLERLGVRVLDEHPHQVTPPAETPLWIVDFGLLLPQGVALERVRAKFHEAFLGMWSGAVEADELNRLVLSAGLSARDITVLRAYTRYLTQAGATFSRSYAEQALVTNPPIAAALVRLFHARFGGAGADGQDGIVGEITAALEHVASLDEDRILRSFLALMQATLRTNFFQGDKPYVSFKLDSARVPGLPEPRPMVEIWVHSPRVEGVHLRGGRVARGGIRWSDRMED
ncbi:MAG TPA: NAD-glutamate dehydrogenase domain-containing protein, partial [Burkholderiales bacterium]|nr:NAD-glutamate dehydrogenase domain-containing protein [Burkholderiales bacterium]